MMNIRTEDRFAIFLVYLEHYSILLNRNILGLIYEYLVKADIPRIPFAVDKDRSLEIMREIISHLPGKEKEKISLNVDMGWEDHYDSDDEDKDKIIEFRHKIAVVELQLDSYCGDDEDIDGEEAKKEFYNAIKNKDWERSTSIEIHSGSDIGDDEICLVAYLHETSAESDVSYPNFSYDELYKCWIIKDSFWGADYGIDCNGIVTILDFSDYRGTQAWGTQASPITFCEGRKPPP